MSEKIIVVGASTGGTEALKIFLMHMPRESPAILVVQHMPAAFTLSFAERLDSLCSVSVKEAEHNEKILPGHVYIAPGHSHLLIKPNRGHYLTELRKSAPINLHRPSVEVLFVSAAEHVGPHSIGIILTGMGNDGARGMQEMHQAGAYNFAQDESTSVVFGMPRKAIMLGAVDEVVPIHEMAPRVLAYLLTGQKITGNRI